MLTNYFVTSHKDSSTGIFWNRLFQHTMSWWIIKLIREHTPCSTWHSPKGWQHTLRSCWSWPFRHSPSLRTHWLGQKSCCFAHRDVQVYADTCRSQDASDSESRELENPRWRGQRAFELVRGTDQWHLFRNGRVGWCFSIFFVFNKELECRGVLICSFRLELHSSW